jgi:Mg-chelatase subunit ChlD
LGRAELTARHPALIAVSPEVGRLDQDAFAGLLAADPDAALALLADLARATDQQLRAAARRLATRVFFRLARAGQPPARGTRRLAGGHADGDLDLDRTLDRWSGPWPPGTDDLVTRSWVAHRRALCLLIDRSGSMSGLAVAIAAVAAASVVLASDGRLSTGIVAFSGQARVLQAQGTQRPAGELVGELVALRGHGLTDLAAALRAAAVQLATAPASERVAVLLSDCLPTSGPDPALALSGIGTLHVLCPRPSTAAEQAAAALARRGGGLCQPVRGLADVAPALTRVLTWSGR